MSYPFVTEAICVLPDHLHAVWRMPQGDADYAKRWGLIKGLFSRAYPAIDYIHYDPVKHGLVTQVKDWPYSSFHRYVREDLLSIDWSGCDVLAWLGE